MVEERGDQVKRMEKKLRNKRRRDHGKYRKEAQDNWDGKGQMREEGREAGFCMDCAIWVQCAFLWAINILSR